MRAYLIRRAVLMVPVFWGVTLFVFLAIRIVPGDVIMSQMTEGGVVDPALREQLTRELGLDVPVHEQYLRWIAGVVHGDLGLSLVSRTPVANEITRRVPISAELAAIAVIIALLIGIPLGIAAAVKRDTWIDYVARFSSVVWLSVPSFVIATSVVMLPAMWWGYSAPLGFVSVADDPVHNLEKFLPAAFALGALLSGVITRLTRSMMLETLREDYVRTARAKGLGSRVVVVRHALKNALIPVITITGDQFATLLGGTVIIEKIYGIPGLGTLALQSLMDKDYTVLQGVTLFFAAVFLIMNLLVDVTYGWFDPRIRYS
ncbi:MAG TPA: ABC transporter permease [Candidatus Limnocylindria bacterium]